MIIPCEECLVSPCCNKACKKLERRLYAIIKPEDPNGDDRFFLLGNDIRKKLVQVTQQNGKFEFLNIKRSKENKR